MPARFAGGWPQVWVDLQRDASLTVGVDHDRISVELITGGSDARSGVGERTCKVALR